MNELRNLESNRHFDSNNKLKIHLLLHHLILVFQSMADLNLVELVIVAAVAVVSKHVTHLVVSDSVGDSLQLSHWLFFV